MATARLSHVVIEAQVTFLLDFIGWVVILLIVCVVAYDPAIRLKEWTSRHDD